MEEKEAKKDKKKLIKIGIFALTAIGLIIKILKTEGKCKKLEGELKNQKETCDGLVKTIKETSYQLGKVRGRTESYVERV